MPASVRSALKGDYQSLQTLAEIFVDALAKCVDDELPCIVTAPTILDILIANPNAELSAEATSIGRFLHRQYPDVLRFCVRFLMRSRSAEAIRALTQMDEPPAVCPCDTKDELIRPILADIHGTHLSLNVRPVLWCPGDLAWQKFVRSLVMVFKLALQPLVETGMQKTLRRMRAAPPFSQRDVWPRSILDIAPYGVDASLRALCTWADHFPRCTGLIEAIQYMYQLLACPGSIRMLVSTIFPIAYMPCLRAALDDLRQPPRDTTDPAQMLHIISRNIQHFMSIDSSHLLHATDGDDMSPWETIADIAFQLWDILASPSHGGDTPETKCTNQIYMLSGSYIHVLLNLQCEPRTPKFCAYIGKEIEKRQSNSLHRLATFAPYINHAYVCGNAPCPETYISKGRLLKACAGCSRVFYCSRRCQKEAWRYERAPHRLLCGPISRIPQLKLARNGSLGGSPAFRISDEVIHFQPHLEDMDVDAGVATEVVEHLVLLYSK